MAIVAITLRVLPLSPSEDLGKLKIVIEKKILALDAKAKLHSTTEQPVAFGLKELICIIAWPEEKDSEILEKELANLVGVSSVQITDVRRAIG
jgi:translation elongation factor aEF-1 beta